MSPLFINVYAEYFDITIKNKIHDLCDNESYVNKINSLILNPKYIEYLYKTTENEVYKLLTTLIPQNFYLHHVKNHQDVRCAYEDLNMCVKLNVQVDKIVTYNKHTPINTYLITPLCNLHCE